MLGLKIICCVQIKKHRSFIISWDYLRMLGQLNSAAPIVPLGQLHIKPLQFYLKKHLEDASGFADDPDTSGFRIYRPSDMLGRFTQYDAGYPSGHPSMFCDNMHRFLHVCMGRSLKRPTCSMCLIQDRVGKSHHLERNYCSSQDFRTMLGSC